MAKESGAVLRGEGGETLCKGELEIGKVASSGFSQMSFEFSEGHFDRVEVGAVSGKIAHARPALRDQGRGLTPSPVTMRA